MSQSDLDVANLRVERAYNELSEAIRARNEIFFSEEGRETAEIAKTMCAARHHDISRIVHDYVEEFVTMRHRALPPVMYMQPLWATYWKEADAVYKQQHKVKEAA